jgi:hypothetical protein
MTNVPRSHGQWGDYRTPRALAWVINVGPASSAWLARCGAQATGPCSFNEAKAAAMAMAKGATGDYTIMNPIRFLNALAAENMEAA